MSEAVFICPACGPGVGADEDECCTVCGSQVFSSAAPWYVAALAAARAEEREAAGDRVECFVYKIAHRWVRLPHNSADGKARDTMLVACARGEMDPQSALAAIRAGGGT